MVTAATKGSAVPARVYDRAVWLLLALLFAANVYKAGTLSITIDEAFTYNKFVAAPFRSYFAEPVGTSNNHPLNTLLCRAAVALLGTSEFTLRLPNLVMGLVYFASAYGLARLLFGPSLWMLLAVSLSCANPFVLDHLSVARGYGLGLAFWTLGTYYLARWVAGEERTGLLVKAGAALALSVASHLMEAFAAAGLAVPFLLMYLVDRAAGGGWRAAWGFVRRGALPFVGAGLVVGVPILWGPARLKFVQEVDGETEFVRGVRSFLDAFLRYRLTSFSSKGPVWTALHRWPWGLLLCFLGLLLVSLAVLVWRWRREGRLERLSIADRLMLVLGGATLVMFFLLRTEPVLLGHVFFGQRRLLGALPLLMLVCPLWFYWLGWQARPLRLARSAGAVLLSLMALHLVSQFTAGSFFNWQRDAGTKRFAQVLRERRPQDAQALVRVGSNPMLSHGLNFYRHIYGMDWLAPLTMDGPVCFSDFYAVYEEELPGLARFAPRVLYRNEVAKTVLAEAGPELRARLAALRNAGFRGSLECGADLIRREAWAAAGTAGVNGHFLRDVMQTGEGDHQRWTFERPAFLFDAPASENPRLALHLRLPPVVLAQTGPIRLRLRVNGRDLGERRLDRPEDHHLLWTVPPNCLRADGLTLVETELDRYYIAPDDGQKLGYLFVAGGFVR